MQKLAAGERYRFVVEMDSCSGCKSCVTACHSMNGLDEKESFRKVGHVSSTNGMPWFQTMTSACHHCLDPLCLKGCPVQAYAKDPWTGIVQHLDDQCIGCQYCLFSCPYEVPVYNEKLGIVRKCDMCVNRINEGDDPACVQACPTDAIRIETATISQIRAEHDERSVPGAPSPLHSYPTTLYRSSKGLPTELEAAGNVRPEPQHAHMSLVMMLVLSQVVLGSLLGLSLLRMLGWMTPWDLRWAYLAIFILNGLGLLIAGLHPGRPWLGFRAVLGWRSSWMSREIIAFGLFSGCFFLHVAALFMELGLGVWTEGALITGGLLAVYCSMQIYTCTPRVFWNWTRTSVRFLGTVLLALWMVVLFLGDGMEGIWITALWMTLIAKGLSEAMILRPQTTASLRRSAQILREALWRPFIWKHAVAMGAGLLLIVGSGSSMIMGVAALILLFCEVMERRMFFQMAVPLPGAWT